MGGGLVGTGLVGRWHLDLGAVALLLGCVIVAVGGLIARVEPAVRLRSVQLSVLAGVCLCGWFGGVDRSRVWPWLVAAGLVNLFGVDGRARTADGRVSTSPLIHPLGEVAVPLTIVSLVGVWMAVPDTEPALAVGLTLVPAAMARVVAARGHVAGGHVGGGRVGGGRVGRGRVGGGRVGDPFPPVGPRVTAALVVAVLGAVWVGSAGWGSALATWSVVGMIAAAPLALGFGRRARRLGSGGVAMESAIHAAVALGTPRFIMGRSVSVAVGISMAVMVAMVVVMRIIDARTSRVV